MLGAWSGILSRLSLGPHPKRQFLSIKRDLRHAIRLTLGLQYMKRKARPVKKKN